MFTKEEILNEMRRTASENGGIPLGASRFEDKTGIAPIEWGRYWPRFGDAQREAGFNPNTLLTAYSNEHLFEKYIALTRELGKIPVQGELVVKRNSDPDFPTKNTFRRLGTKLEFLSQLLKYSEDKGYNDVVKFCNAALEKENEIKPEGDFQEQEALSFVYLVKSGHYYKIGKTNASGRREYELAIQLPEKLIVIHKIETDDPTGIENYWHRRFESKRKKGEWFDLNPSDIRAFRRWKRI